MGPYLRVFCYPGGILDGQIYSASALSYCVRALERLECLLCSYNISVGLPQLSNVVSHSIVTGRPLHIQCVGNIFVFL